MCEEVCTYFRVERVVGEIGMKNLLLLKDMRGWFWSTYPDWSTPVSLDVGFMEKYFFELGYHVEVSSYPEFDYTKSYADYLVLYSSAEDYCGGSKAFIEDVLLYLRDQGARLLPEFRYFRAHDNKVMMEMLRYEFQDEGMKTIHTQVWSSYEALKEAGIEKYPVIVKRAGGAGGEGVFLAHNRKELNRYAERVSRLTNLLQFYYLSCVNVKQRLLGKAPVRINNTKFITQTYIPGLQGDFKVLVFGNHYYVLHRLNRKKDFRASGSGRFIEDNTENIEQILDFAEACTKEIRTPWISLDICHDGERCHLIEFQCITFGFKAMSMSTKHYERIEDSWRTVEGSVVPEEEFCYSVRYFLENQQQA